MSYWLPWQEDTSFGVNARNAEAKRETTVVVGVDWTAVPVFVRHIINQVGAFFGVLCYSVCACLRFLLDILRYSI